MVALRKFRLTIEEPSETDIQADILRALGRQDRVLVDRKGQKVWVLDGLYKRPGGVFWRANCGGGMANGRVIRGNPNGTADILGVFRGLPVAIEVKAREGKQRASQAHWQAAWEAGTNHGHETEVVAGFAKPCVVARAPNALLKMLAEVERVVFASVVADGCSDLVLSCAVSQTTVEGHPSPDLPFVRALAIVVGERQGSIVRRVYG